MSKTQAIRLAMELGGRGINATAVGFRYVGRGYERVVWSVEVPNKEKIPGV